MMHPDLATLLVRDISQERPRQARQRFLSRRPQRAGGFKGR